ncbi:hypothetical protein [Streptomyces sp. NPDC047079]|uniref:hypothetical protein n=1 Tax=Streptomyces sp. NPDC047079 TaxID=3154607 RepID=UPI0033DDEB95
MSGSAGTSYLSAPRKQRHTVDRVLQRLAAEHDFEHASYSTVRDYVRRWSWRRGRGATTWRGRWPGEEAEVDFADLWLDLAGQRRKCVLFPLRMSYSGKA